MKTLGVLLVLGVTGIISVSINYAFAENDVNFITDKTLYQIDDVIQIFGIVDYEPGKTNVLVELFNPEKTIEDSSNYSVNLDGTFTASFHVGLSEFPYYGMYTIKVTYGDSVEKTIEYQEFSMKKCKDGFKLIIKKSTESQNCVKESSFEKLIQRGWGLVPVYEPEEPEQCLVTEGEQEFIPNKYTPIEDYPLISKLILEGLMEKNQNTTKILVEYKGNFFYETECEKLDKERMQLREEVEIWFESCRDMKNFPNAEQAIEMHHTLHGICGFAGYGN